MAATRQLGFSLKVVGSDKTISELAKIEKAINDVAKKINQVQKSNIKLSTQFDSKGFDELLKTLNKVEKAKLNPQILTTVKDLKSQLVALQTQVAKTSSELESVKAPKGLSDEQVSKVNGSFTKLNGAAKIAVETIARLKPAIQNIDDKSVQDLYKSLSKVEISIKEISKQRNQVLRSGDISNEEKTSLLSGLNQELDQLNLKKKEIKTSIKEVNTAFVQQAKNIPLDSIIGLRKELSQLTKEYELMSQEELRSAAGQQLKNKIESIHSTVSKQEQAIGNFRRNVGNYENAVRGLIPEMERLSAAGIIAQKEITDIFKADLLRKQTDLQAEIQKLGNEFKELGTDISKTADRAALLEKLEAKVRELASTRTAIDSFGGSLTRLGGRLASVSDIVTGGLIGGGLIGLVAGIVQAGKQTISVNRELADTQADVRKTTGLTTDEINELTEAFKKFDTRTATNDLLKIAAVAGQLGIEGKSGVAAFTKSIDVLNVALGDELPGGAEEIANRIAKLSNVLFGSSKSGEEMADRMLFLGNTLNELSASSAATSDKVVEFATRMGRTLAPLGATADQVLALSATFDELGLLPEQGATAINNLIKDIGANTKLFAETLSISQKELRETFNTDPIEAFNIVLKKVNELSGGDQTKALDLLKELKQTGEGVSSVFFQLSKNSELYSRNLKLSNKAILETSSIFNEFKVKNENLAGVFDKLGKKIQDFATDKNIVALVETLGKVLTGTITVLGEVFGGLSAIYERLTLNVKDNSDIIKGSFLDVQVGSLKMGEAQFTMQKNISQAISTIKKEQAVLDASIKILDDETSSRTAKNRVIQELLDKYPGLISKYQLEGASSKELGEIQKQLTATLKKEVFERIKTKTEEALETQRINLLIRQTELDLGGGLSGVQGFLADAFGRKAEVIELEKKNVAKQLDDTNKIIEEKGKVFQALSNKLGVDFSEGFSNLNYGKVRANLAGLIQSIESVIDDNKIGAKTSAILNSISEDAVDLINTVKLDATTAELEEAFKKTISLQGQFEKSVQSSNVKIGDTNDLKDLGNEKTDKEVKGQKEIADQLQRILELKQKITDLQIESISNEFDRSIEQTKEKTRREIDEIQKKINALELKPVKTDADLIEIEQSKKLIDALQKAGDAAIAKINKDRNTALKESIKELKDTRDEVLSIASEINKIDIEFKISQGQFELEQAERTIEIKFNDNLFELNQKLNTGLISEKEYNQESVRLENEKLNKIAKLYAGFEAEFKSRLQRQAQAEKDFLTVTYQQNRQNIQDELQLELQSIRQKKAEGSIDTAAAEELRLEKIKKAKEQIKQLDKQYSIDKININNDLLSSEQDFQDARVRAAQDANNAISQSNKEAADEEEKRRRGQLALLRDQSLQLAEEISSAIFDLEAQNSELQFDNNKSRIEKNYENQLRAAEGNAQEVERIEREKSQKIAEIEKQQGEKRKAQAIQEAIIQGAIAVLKALPNLILAAFVAAATVVQIAKIKATKFAEGAYFNAKGRGGFTGGSFAPPDETGERPIGTGVLHANEYIATAKQTTKNDWLFDLLDQDRKRTNAGAETNLEAQIAQAIQNRRKVLFDIQGAGRKRFEPVIPVVIPFGGSGKTNIEFTDAQIERLADAISERVERGASRGTSAGTSEGIKQATKEALRSERTNLRKVI